MHLHSGDHALGLVIPDAPRRAAAFLRGGGVAGDRAVHGVGTPAALARYRRLLPGAGHAAGEGAEPADVSVADPGESRVPADWLWLGRLVKVGEGTTLLPPDTRQSRGLAAAASAEARAGFPGLAEGGLVFLGPRRREWRGRRTVQGERDGRAGLVAGVVRPLSTRRCLSGRRLFLLLLPAGVAARAGRGRRSASTPATHDRLPPWPPPGIMPSWPSPTC